MDAETYEKIQAIPFKERRLSRKLFVFEKCLHAHEQDLAHITDNLIDAIVGSPAVLELPRKFTDLLRAMYDIESIPNDELLHECSFCKAISEAKMKQCACKRGFRYCSTQCQRQDWRAGHRLVCSQASA